MERTFLNKTSWILISALIALTCLNAPALAAPDEDLQTLEMFYEGKDLAVSATRSPKPLSQTAENVTIITAAEIEMMGAHTLADVLNNVSGLQVDGRGSVGTFSGFSIYGADMFQVLVMEDGVTVNFLGDGSPDIASIPVQNIDRVEIIKGPGSSSWGSALGGVVNIVTKSPDDEKKLGGTLSFSAGEKETRDTRGELSGTLDRLGYYLYAGNLRSNGLQPITGIDANNLYGKLRWELPRQGNLLLTLGYTRQNAGQGGSPSDLAINDHPKYDLFYTAALNYPLGKVDLDLALRGTNRYLNEDILLNFIDPAANLSSRYHESSIGGSAKVTWREKFQTLVAGIDYDHYDNWFHSNFTEITDQNFSADKWGVFLNDTLTFRDVAITPGIRYDYMHPVGNFISPSLGVAWNPDEKTTLRAYAARGYSLPLIVPGATQEKVCSFQVGGETSHIPYLWLKTTLFLNYIKDHESSNFILVKQKKQGLEVETKTAPLFNTSLSAGYTFVDARDRDTGNMVKDIPRQIVKMGLHYDDKRTFRAALLGRYVFYNASPELNAKDSAVIWDLTLAKQVLVGQDFLTIPGSKLELFFNAHNLFNGAQYPDASYTRNVRRWLEGGLRFNF